MNSLLFRAIALVALSILPVGFAAGQQERPCAAGQAKVVQVEEDGTWETAEGRTIRTGQCISVPATVEAGAPASLTIFFGGNDPAPKTYLCENQAGCRVPISAPAKSAGNPGARARAEKIFASLKKPRLSLSPEMSTMTYVRGINGDLTDSVVPLTATRMDLAPAFQKMAEGKYWLQIVPLGVPAKALGPFQIVWNAKRSAVLSNPEFRPGLYNLVLREESGEAEGSQAWVLAVESPVYGPASADFEDAVKVSKQWNDVAPSAVRAILRAYLESLGPQASGQTAP